MLLIVWSANFVVVVLVHHTQKSNLRHSTYTTESAKCVSRFGTCKLYIIFRQLQIIKIRLEISLFLGIGSATMKYHYKTNVSSMYWWKMHQIGSLACQFLPRLLKYSTFLESWWLHFMFRMPSVRVWMCKGCFGTRIRKMHRLWIMYVYK